jgi:hypothetical protein
MKILFVWPNKDGFGFKPISLALMSAILKIHGHQFELFDTTYIDFGYQVFPKSATRSEYLNRLISAVTMSLK